MKNLEKLIGTPLDGADRLGWFGFSADPPTLAHRTIVDAVLGSGLVQKVIVFPAGKLPYKDFGASDWQRKDMVELWKASSEYGDEVVLSTFDLLRPKAIVWHELWRRLQEISSSVRHFFIVGSDQYREIPKTWSRGKELFESASFIIVPREGWDVVPQREGHLLLPIEPIPGSSTSVRSGDLSLVDERVKDYILEHGLYQS
ncbi:MAG: nicotinate-nicotinamide nucleotide adenylyltransferase [Candidatus Altimarinota bacterium]